MTVGREGEVNACSCLSRGVDEPEVVWYAPVELLGVVLDVEELHEPGVPRLW